MSSRGRIIVAFAACTGLCLLGLELGAWEIAFPAGLALGWSLPRARIALPAAAVAGLVAWMVPLVVDQIQYGLAPTTTSMAAIMGFKGAATIPLALTVLVGALLAGSGAWLGSAAVSALRPVVSRRAGSGQHHAEAGR